MSNRRLGIAIFLSACLALISQSAAAQDYSYARVVRLSLVDGSVQVLRPEAEGWEDGLVNLPIRQGYTISTAFGRAEIEFESGATARLAEHSTLEFTELALADGNRLTRMLLQRGTATFYANLSRNDVFEVSTPHLSLDVPDNARFRVDALDWGTTVSTLKGEVNVSSSAGPYRVTKGQTLTFNPGAAEPALLTRNRELDDWDRWVADREETITTASSNSSRYVNSSVRYGLADLSNYGGWFYDASHGYLWQPWGYGAGWSPYLQGRWVFIHGAGWTWVSFEPWGWLPYHYGRWILTGRGWGWIPGGFGHWHPGLVSWVNFGNFIGWCPLGPRDRPGVRPRNPQGGVVIINTPNGAVGGTPNNVANVNPNSRPQFVDHSPLPHNPRGFVDDGRFEKNPHIQRGQDSAETPAGTPAQGAGATIGTRPQTAGETPGIVYDPNEKRFVNNPNAPARPDTRDSDRPATFGTPLRPAEQAGASTPPREPRSETPATRPQGSTQSGPQSGPSSGWSSRPEPSRPPRAEPRPTAPPRSETSRPQPPRTESPRPSPQPRTETPRPSPPPRVDSPRPSGGMGIGGAPRERPSPPPRTEAPRPRPPRD